MAHSPNRNPEAPSNSLADLAFPTGFIVSARIMGANNQCRSDLSGLSTYLLSTPSQAALDGAGKVICVLDSGRLSTLVGGAPVQYRNIALVSPGNDGVIDPASRITAQGQMTLGGDDKGVLVDGLAVMTDRVIETLAKMTVIVNALDAYYQARAAAGGTMAAQVDCFANGGTDALAAQYDAGGSIPSTGGIAKDLVVTGIYTTLGLSQLDVTDGFGNLIQFDNSSAAVRSPSNPTPAQTVPPYTAQISTTLPGGAVYTRTIVGSY